MTLAADDPRHGTMNGYHNLRCRCAPCTEAWRVWSAEMRERKQREGEADPSRIPHGTVAGYVNWGCRCAPCQLRRTPGRWPSALPKPLRSEVLPPVAPDALVQDAVAWLARHSCESVKSIGAAVGRRVNARKVRTLPCRRRGLNGWSMTDLDRIFPDLVSAIGSEAAVPPVAASDRVAEPRAESAIEQDAPPP